MLANVTSWHEKYVIPLELPPLRGKGDDVLEIAQSFTDRFNVEEGREIENLHREPPHPSVAVS